VDISLVDLTIEIISGAIGGYLAGRAMRDLSLGTIGNSIVGAIGGLVAGYSLRAGIPVLGSSAGGISFGVIIGQLVTGMSEAQFSQPLSV